MTSPADGGQQCLAQYANSHAHDRIAYGGLRPDSIQQLVFARQTVRVRYQVGQHVERFGRQATASAPRHRHTLARSNVKGPEIQRGAADGMAFPLSVSRRDSSAPT